MKTVRSKSPSGGRRRALTALTTSAVLLGIIIFVAVGLATWVLFFSSSRTLEDGRPVRVEIPAGASTAAIARSLASAEVIDNPNAFRVRARLSGADGRLKVGTYELRTGMSDKAVIALLKAGPKSEFVSVTIPEGFVLPQIAKRLEDQAGIPQAEFLALAKGGADEFKDAHPYLSDAYEGSLEGYLFPKTYRIRAGSSAREVIETMLRQFDTETRTLDRSYAAGRGLSFNQLVVLASMIERESKLERERPLVSSVIYNRLEKDMRLEIDATIEYVLPGNRFRLSNRDLRIDSPYNTYRLKGLPPGPISNPGIAALQAAASPAETDYLYYVLTGKDGSHTFAETKAEFLIAKKKSKEVFGR